MKHLKKLFSIKSYIELFSKNWLNIPQTLFINFYFLPFKQAIKLPIWIYGNIRFIKMNGEIKIEAKKVSTKMIIINRTNESPCNSNGNTEFIINTGILLFKGKAQIGCGCRILVYNHGKIIFGEDFKMNNQNFISSSHGMIKFDKMVVIAHQSQIYNTDFHFYSTQEGVTRNSTKNILIGAYTVIANRVTISKGVTLPSYTTISSNSLVNKTLPIESGTIIGGIPAKPLAKNYYRIRNNKIESILYQYFKNHPNEKSFKLDDSFEIWTNY